MKNSEQKLHLNTKTSEAVTKQQPIKRDISGLNLLLKG